MEISLSPGAIYHSFLLLDSGQAWPDPSLVVGGVAGHTWVCQPHFFWLPQICPGWWLAVKYPIIPQESSSWSLFRDLRSDLFLFTFHIHMGWPNSSLWWIRILVRLAFKWGYVFLFCSFEATASIYYPPVVNKSSCCLETHCVGPFVMLWSLRWCFKSTVCFIFLTHVPSLDFCNYKSGSIAIETFVSRHNFMAIGQFSILQITELVWQWSDFKAVRKYFWYTRGIFNFF